MHTHANPPQQKNKKIPTVAGLLLCDANRQECPGSVHLEWSLQPSMLAFTAQPLICNSQEFDCHQPATRGAGAE